MKKEEWNKGYGIGYTDGEQQKAKEIYKKLYDIMIDENIGDVLDYIEKKYDEGQK